MKDALGCRAIEGPDGFQRQCVALGFRDRRPDQRLPRLDDEGLDL